MELQEDVMTDFQDELLQKQWVQHQMQIMQRAEARTKSSNERRSKVEQQMEQFREKNTIRQANLDSKIDDLNARFSDLRTEIAYDAASLEKKLGNGPTFGNKDKTCLSARMEVASCYKNGIDVLACDGVVESLERCIKKTIMEDAAKQ
eukprot:CAMPEP_0195528976 /NCGR_PEP_ID=MMETSP0794_2-20130614/31353_1 /TAXON_ID=515487 /ORGANISM="Stephanopyxis turris, Strain CCMP 815" /LENGTH=147 /DNA_ID=CAMNT_0040660207 /DNA_START=213 /DNA_END=656 /DNA_ORIENTATION=-